MLPKTIRSTLRRFLADRGQEASYLLQGILVT
jgi:hypothetical protein